MIAICCVCLTMKMMWLSIDGLVWWHIFHPLSVWELSWFGSGDSFYRSPCCYTTLSTVYGVVIRVHSAILGNAGGKLRPKKKKEKEKEKERSPAVCICFVNDE